MTATMEERLDAVFSGSLAYARGTLAFVENEPGGPTARALFEPDLLQSCLDAFGRTHGDADPRAMVSYWSLWYFGGLLVPAVAATVALGRALPLRLDQVRLTLDPDQGRVTSFAVPAAWTSGMDAPPPASAGFDPLIVEHLAPVVDILATRYRVGRGLLWGNAAHYIEWALGEVASVPGMAKGVSEARAGLLEPPEWPGLDRNPLHGAIRYVRAGGDRVRLRRVCCLRHLVPGVIGCGSLCPREQVRAAYPSRDG